MVGMQEGGVEVDGFWACGAVRPQSRRAFGPFAQQLKDKVGVHECWLSRECVLCMVGMQEGVVDVDVFWACGAVRPQARHAIGPFAQQFKGKVGVHECSGCPVLSCVGGEGGRGGC